MKDNLGDRIKRFEDASRITLVPRMPVVVRLDGRCFSNYTRKCFRPYDAVLQNAMVLAGTKVAEDMQGFKVGYHQSDEISFLITDFDTHETCGWFDYDLRKIVSITASLMTGFFNIEFRRLIDEYNATNTGFHPLPTMPACFDCRAFNVPREDVSNVFLWRAKDWERNSLMMYARSLFSHKELNGKKKTDIHEMLHSKGANWVKDIGEQSRNGTLFYKMPRNPTAQQITKANKIVNGFVWEHPNPSYAVFSPIIEPYLVEQNDTKN